MLKKDTYFAERPHVLIVDDDIEIRQLLYRYLSHNGFIVIEAANADEGDVMRKSFMIDMMVVDVMMPGRTGFDFVAGLRKDGDTTPALFLTAMSQSDDKIQGFESGADDYLVKPFEPKELVYRIHAILKRVPSARDTFVPSFRMGDLKYDISQSVLRKKDDIIILTEGDLTLLKTLAKARGETVDRYVLAEACGVDPDGRNVDVQVTRLRAKIEEDTRHPLYLKTVRGIGYALKADYDD